MLPDQQLTISVGACDVAQDLQLTVQPDITGSLAFVPLDDSEEDCPWILKWTPDAHLSRESEEYFISHDSSVYLTNYHNQSILIVKYCDDIVVAFWAKDSTEAKSLIALIQQYKSQTAKTVNPPTSAAVSAPTTVQPGVETNLQPSVPQTVNPALQQPIFVPLEEVVSTEMIMSLLADKDAVAELKSYIPPKFHDRLPELLRSSALKRVAGKISKVIYGPDLIPFMDALRIDREKLFNQGGLRSLDCTKIFVDAMEMTFNSETPEQNQSVVSIIPSPES